MSAEPAVVPGEPSPELVRLLDWLLVESCVYARVKWDFAVDNLERVRQGIGEDSWLWERGVLNYAGRVRLFGLDSPLGRQAYMKLTMTLLGLGEAMLTVYGDPPPPGQSSGNAEDPGYRAPARVVPASLLAGLHVRTDSWYDDDEYEYRCEQLAELQRGLAE